MKNKQSESGLTMVEILITFTLAGLIGLGVIAVGNLMSMLYRQTAAATRQNEEVEATLDFMAMELRGAIRFLAAGNDNNNLTFVNDSDMQVNYSYNPATQQVTRNGQLLIRNVTAWNIAYLNPAPALDRFNLLTITLNNSTITINPRSIIGQNDPDNPGWIN